MQQASCWQARRQVKGGAQQSPDCEHPSEFGNAAWRHEAPLHQPVGATRRVERDTGAFFWFVFFRVKENEQSLWNQYHRIGKIYPGLHQRRRGYSESKDELL